MRSTHRFALRSLLLKTSAATAPDLARSVIAVPPLARLPSLELNLGANRALIRHLDEGGVTTLMYGGNANFYNVGLYEYAAILDFLEHAVENATIETEHHVAIRNAAQTLLATDRALTLAPATVGAA